MAQKSGGKSSAKKTAAKKSLSKNPSAAKRAKTSGSADRQSFLTNEIKGYLSKMYTGSATERVGCVPVDARLAEILQLLMDKYTFENVDNSWTKLCYYYDYLGPNG